MDPGRRRALPIALLIIVLGLGFWLRVLDFTEWRHDPLAKVLVADEQWYWDSASLIASGQSPTGDEPYYFGPFYSYALAPLIAMGASHETIVLLQHLLGLVNGLLVFLIGRKIFGIWAGVIGAAFALLSPVVIYYESLLLMETLLTSLLLLSLWLLSFSETDHDRASSGSGKHHFFTRVIAAGILLGLVATGRPALIVLPVVVGLWLWKFYRPRRAAQLLLASLVVVLIPIGRNIAVTGEFTPITSSGGFNLYLGNGPEATGTSIDISPFGSALSMGGRSYAEGRSGRRLTAGEASSFWMKKTLDHVKAHPGSALVLLAKKAWLLIGNDELPQIEWFGGDRRRFPALRIIPVPFVLLLFLAALGVWPALRSKTGLLLIAVAISAGVVLIPFFITARFRVSWIPLLSLLAGSGVVAMAKEMESRQLKRTLLVLLPAVVLACLSLYPPGVVDRKALESMYEARQAKKFAAEGFYSQAIHGFQKALSIEPRNYWARIALGAQYRAEHNWRMALSAYQTALDLVPDDAEALYGLGIALFRTGKPQEALRALDRARAIWPYDPRIIEYRGIVLDRLGEASKAEQAFREAIRLDGKRASAHLNYAAFLSLHGRLDVAIRQYRIALSLDPSSKLASRNLLLALLQTGDFPEAEKMARALPRTDPARAFVLAKIDSLRAVNGRE